MRLDVGEHSETGDSYSGQLKNRGKIERAKFASVSWACCLRTPFGIDQQRTSKGSRAQGEGSFQ